MVKGLEIFADHFKDHTDKFILIGGTACDLAMSQMGLGFRATKDLDIVLVIEVLNSSFSACFWDFIKQGGYQNLQKSSGKKVFYRFYAPSNEDYPYMLELLSRKPDALAIPHGRHLARIPIADDCSSLSAILLADDYYQFIFSGIQPTEGLRFLNAEHLIPLKAKAHLDLLERKRQLQPVKSDDIKKHKNDIFRLFQIMTPASSVALTASIAGDLKQFCDLMSEDPPDLKSLGIKMDALEVIARLRTIYNLE